MVIRNSCESEIRRLIMFEGIIGNEYKYDFAEEKFKVAFEFLKRKDLAELEVGVIELGKGVRAQIQHYNTFDKAELSFETHEKFFDIQYVVEGEEKIGVCSRRELIVKTPYSVENDIAFYEKPSRYGEALLLEGDFILLAPEDAHMPRCNVEKSVPVKKIVVKIPV
jgi:uncharacterized protein, YhcH/YjgK/YiaL family